MNRYRSIDNIRGIAFLFMIIHHIFYFYDVSNNFNTSYSKNIFVNSSGIIARTLFILLAGVSLTFLNKKDKKDKKDKLKKRFKRSIEIGLHAMVITFITYLFYPKLFIRFGILHFIALSTFICSFIAPHKKLTILIFIISLIYTPPKINPIIDTITGSSTNFSMLDWFPLKSWISLLLFGIILGYNKEKLENLKNIKLLQNNNILTKIGQKSLEFYTIHVILLIIIFNIKKKYLK
jgi:uncharacterized membrane protein